VLLSDALGELFLSTTRGTHQDYALRSARSLGMLELKHAKHNFLSNLDLALVGISHCNRALLDLFHSFNV